MIGWLIALLFVLIAIGFALKVYLDKKDSPGGGTPAGGIPPDVKSPQWICRYCETINSGDFKRCVACGKPSDLKKAGK